MLPTDRLEYDLPESLIATRPAEPRDASRLMVIRRSDPDDVRHVRFRDLPTFLRSSDVLVRNVSRVAPARLEGVRMGTGGVVRGLFLREIRHGSWVVMLRSNGKLRVGTIIDLDDAGDVRIELEGREDAAWVVRVTDGAGQDLASPAPVVLERVGATPLPPYILGARRDQALKISDESDRAWYQTVYAAADRIGSVAAPTAGLHFTPGLIESLSAKGVSSADVTLHVGAGTFKPVEASHVEAHDIHAEAFSTPPGLFGRLADVRASGGRVIAVGTTTVRTLESVSADEIEASDGAGVARETRLLIAPGYQFRRIDGMITNFHLPRSTLLALVAAFLPGGVDRLLDVYREAVRREYRFYSYGDAMLILP
ncbi:MAG: tRNA preQ1(34) S-adenosylmethionine ribosyltransferase-isomerase QueA [Phycisphaerales bacterium]